MQSNGLSNWGVRKSTLWVNEDRICHAKGILLLSQAVGTGWHSVVSWTTNVSF